MHEYEPTTGCTLIFIVSCCNPAAIAVNGFNAYGVAPYSYICVSQWETTHPIPISIYNRSLYREPCTLFLYQYTLCHLTVEQHTLFLYMYTLCHLNGNHAPYSYIWYNFLLARSYKLTRNLISIYSPFTCRRISVSDKGGRDLAFGIFQAFLILVSIFFLSFAENFCPLAVKNSSTYKKANAFTHCILFIVNLIQPNSAPENIHDLYSANKLYKHF